MNTPSATGKALLLIDLQNDFVEDGLLAVPGGLEVIDIANRLIPRFELVVATQDWHPADHQSFASQHSGLAIGDSFELNGLPQTAWPDHCVQETFGAEFVDQLNREGIQRVVRKGTDSRIDSYSGFFDNGHLRSTGLADYLREQEVDHVYVMGLATDYCVRFTALDAIREGFRTTLITDGCRGVELRSGDIKRAIEELTSVGVEITSSSQIPGSTS
ncbi:MAG: bifunctional nicotinamidase/pyrazinamidase [Planctomycetota bacterium]|nr:bifunctional nicotinamidase/pyrazinamidase [Planctomycetota bacterium]